MNKINKVLLYIVYFFISISAISPIYAQELPSLRDRANRLFQEYQYSNAIAIYLKLLDTSTPRLADMVRLAESYQKVSNYGDAEYWYARVIQDPKSKSEYLIHYAEVLKQNAKYADAKKAFQSYVNKMGESEYVDREIEGCDSAIVWMANPTLHKVVNELEINTKNSEFSAYPMNGQVYFAGEPDGDLSNKYYGWTGNSYLQVYTADCQDSNKLINPLVSELYPFNKANYPLDEGIYHIGPISSDTSGNILFVTRTYSGKHAKVEWDNKMKYQTHKLELYIYSKEENGNWKTTPFVYNNVEKYSMGHASLSPDGNVLYFVSDMPGGQGGTDIWFCEKQKDGSWGQPINAGAIINTTKDELFPSIASDGNLYYSSNGLPGMGGLDIFSSSGSKDAWTKSVNLRYPLNSAGDDFAFINSENTEDHIKGYLSSNRQGGQGNDDIYSYRFLKEKPKVILMLKGMAYNKQTEEVLLETSVSLSSEGKTLMAKMINSIDSSFLFELDKEVDYQVLGEKSGFLSDSSKVSTKGLTKSDTLYVSLYLDPLLVKGKTYQLDNIRYNFDKDDIRPDAEESLNKLLTILMENPTMKIELSSHTDSRGSSSYNMNLSQRRAQSAVNYLVGRGISRSRMIAKGYGETRLLNSCADGIKCSDEEHEVNRRTEFTILDF